MAEPRFSLPIRVMAMEIVLADILVKMHRSTADPRLSLNTQRQKFGWFMRENQGAIQDALRDRFYSEELELCIDSLFGMAEALLELKIFDSHRQLTEVAQ